MSFLFIPPRLRLPALAMACLLLPAAPAQVLAGRSIAGQPPGSGTTEAGAATVSSETYHLHGVVLDSRTGKPIPRALVQCFGDRIATLTDHSGRFALDLRYTASGPNASALQRGLVNQQNVYTGLSARRPGYSSGARQQVIQSIPLSALDSDLVLKLVPGSSIEGRIAASGDDHPEGVQISLLTRRVQNGMGRWQQTGATTTNSRGEYRFADLQPGEYKLITREWSDQPAQPVNFDKPLSRYAPALFPAGSTAVSGPDIHLAAGEALQANINLHPQTFYPVRIPVAPPESPTGGNVGVQVRVLQGGAAAGFAFRYNARDRLAQGMLPSGSYDVVLQSNGSNPAGAMVPVVVGGGPLELGTVTLLPTPSIPIVVHQEFTQGSNQAMTGLAAANNTPPVQISLLPEDMTLGSGARQVQDRGDPTHLSLDRVMPGTYTVQSFAMRGYIASMTSGGTDLLQHPLVVSPSGGAQSIEVTVRDDAGNLEGTVEASAIPAADPGVPNAPPVFVFCVPVDQAARPTQQNLLQPDGSFRLFNVPPGSYRVFASRQSFDTIEYRSEAWLKANGGKGAPVTVEPNGKATVTLTSVLDETP